MIKIIRCWLKHYQIPEGSISILYSVGANIHLKADCKNGLNPLTCWMSNITPTLVYRMYCKESKLNLTLTQMNDIFALSFAANHSVH